MNKLDDFDFDVPESLIAHRPVQPRHNSKLLHVDRDILTDSFTYNLYNFIKRDDIIVFNDTRVIKARLFGYIDDKQTEILLIKPNYKADHDLNGELEQWFVYAKKSKSIKLGQVIIFAEDLTAFVVAKQDNGELLIQFNFKSNQPGGQSNQVGIDSNHDHTNYSNVSNLDNKKANDSFMNKIDTYGTIPLPPYIKRMADETDLQDYQTIYAKHSGSIAAPTAGLHFTEEMMANLDVLGLNYTYVTLHVGPGTFRPIRHQNIGEHKMHEEYGCVSELSAQKINDCKKKGGRVICVGTTSMRLIESATNSNNELCSYDGSTGIFITPGYKFKIADMLFTNFHIPKSTLFILVCAFCGIDNMKKAYNHAINNKYRFYSYGDAMLLNRAII